MSSNTMLTRKCKTNKQITPKTRKTKKFENATIDKETKTKKDRTSESDQEKEHANPHSILSEDNENIKIKSKSDENKTHGNQELTVIENSRKEDDELTWHNADGKTHGTRHSAENITQEMLEKAISKMRKVLSELRESNDMKSNVENNESQEKFKTNEKLEMMKKQIDLIMTQ